MNKLEVEFIEAYKQAESFCNDALSCESGVSEYINAMKEMSGTYRLAIPSWESDLRMLKRLRFVRNKIAHESGDSGCTEADLKNAKSFFARLVNREDPIAEAEELKRKSAEKKENRRKPAKTEKEKAAPREEENEEPDLQLWTDRKETTAYEPRRTYAYAKKENGDPPPKGCLLAFLIAFLAGGITLIILALLNII